jgi:hypothetical protein
MNEIVPFGKYKGQPIEVLSHDEAYVDWLLAQDWVKARYQNIYNVIINNFQAPSETPEHNIAQAAFLDIAYVMRFLKTVVPGAFKIEPPKIYSITMEEKGVDVVIGFSYVFEHVITEEYAERVRTSYVYGADHRPAGVYIEHVYGDALCVEIKPALGDDYPAVLRQMKNCTAYKNRHGRMILYVGNFTGIISKEQLVAFFAGDNIKVVFQQEVESSD